MASNSLFICGVCGVSFTRKDSLRRHQVKQQHSELVPSALAGPSGVKRTAASTVDGPAAKRDRGSSTPTTRCDTCDEEVPTASYAAHLRSNIHKNAVAQPLPDDTSIQIIATAFKSRIATYRVTNVDSIGGIPAFLDAQRERFERLVGDRLKAHTALKINCELFGLYTKITSLQRSDDVKSFNTRNTIVTSSSDLGAIFRGLSEVMNAKSDEFQERESGWSLKEVLYLEININKYRPMRGSSYIPLPGWIKAKNAIINVQNADNACFAWAVLAALHPAQHDPQRVSKYPHYSTVLNLEGIVFPMEMTSIKKFEELNDVSINVFGVEGKSIVGPLHFTERKRVRHVNLLYIQDGERAHFCWIKNLGRLVGRQLSSDCAHKWLCDGCLVYFRSEVKLREHTQNDCNHVVTTMPTAFNNILEFKNIHKQLRVPFVVYADFESVLKPISSSAPDASASYTNNVQQHEPYSFAYYIKCSYDERLNKLELYRGPDAAKVLMQKLKQEARRLGEILKCNIPMAPLTPLDELLFAMEVDCGICGKALGDDRVKDHDHLTGAFRFAAHPECNIKYTMPKFIPVVFHNLSGYDSHFIVKELGCDQEKVTEVPNNKERFISFTKFVRLCGDEPADEDEDAEDGQREVDKSQVQLRFIDSLRFMSSSLDSLAKNLEPVQFEEMRKCFPDDREFTLLTRKGVFPYSHVTDVSVLEEVFLPPKEAFFNNLTSEHISFQEYGHAQKVWRSFNIQTLGEYSDLYLKTDVLLLADIFENFRNVCLKTYDLDPCQYLTAPSLSWDAMLKHTGVKLELLTDVEMHHFIRKGIRGGLTQCSGRYAKANNKHMGEEYDAAQPSKYLTYLDANNLYGWAMSQYLPAGAFRWLGGDQLDHLRENILDIPATSDKGYILEVDLEYPETLHDEHNDLPFCPENMVPPTPNSRTPKLLATLLDKQRYIIHYRNLQQCLRGGLNLKAVHRVMEFDQSPWLKGYIDLNTRHRTLAKNAFEKDFFKLMINSIFGKTMENVEKRVDVKIVTRWEHAGKSLCASGLIARPNFNSCIVLDENLVIIQMDRVKVAYDKPIYAGFAILDISKTLMYDFHYRTMKSLYGSKLSLLYTDTDSLIYSIETDDFYSDLSAHLDYFDTSDYPPDNKYNIPLVNKKVVGKFKDEMCGNVVLEFVGSRAKSYCIISEKDVIKKIKGVNRSVVNKEISVSDFRNIVVNNSDALMHTMTRIQSVKHALYTRLVNRISLSGDDDKRYIIPGSTNTYAWGHKNIALE